MIEVYGDLWDYPAQVICLTTNGTIKKNGHVVMGRGVAQQARDKFRDLDLLLATMIRREGLRVSFLTTKLFSFPVKYNWWEKADLELISKSARQLAQIASDQPNLIFVLPRPGCGNGQRTWDEVKPLLQDLPDNVHVIDRG